MSDYNFCLCTEGVSAKDINFYDFYMPRVYTADGYECGTVADRKANGYPYCEVYYNGDGYNLLNCGPAPVE